MKLNNKTYLTKTEIIKLIQNILHTNKMYNWLQNNDQQILLDLLKHHPSYKIKKGCGIKGFKIAPTQYKKKGFILYRNDGSYTDFSYLQCITSPTLLSKIKQACRTAISQDIINFKIKKFNSKQTIRCEISNIDLSFNNCHVDHSDPSFKDIFKQWIKNKKISLKDINHSKDNEETVYFTNKNLEKDFKLFHDTYANLRIISPKINLSLPK